MKNCNKWARDLVLHKRDSLDYFIEFGSPIEQILAEAVVEYAEMGQ